MDMHRLCHMMIMAAYNFVFQSFFYLFPQYAGGDECSSDDVLGVIHELKGWREVLLPLSSVLRWDKPYHPVIIVGTTTFFFS